MQIIVESKNLITETTNMKKIYKDNNDKAF